MGLNLSDFPPEQQEALRAKYPELREALGGREASATPAAPVGGGAVGGPSTSSRPMAAGAQPPRAPGRRRNPFMGPSLRGPGGAQLGGRGGNPLFSANDRPFGEDAERPMPPGAPQRRPAPQVRDAVGEAAEAARQRAEFSAKRKAEQMGAQPAIHGNNPRAPGGPLHPQQFGNMPARHMVGLMSAHYDALSHLASGHASFGDVLRFASGEHLEPTYRRIDREERMALQEHRLQEEGRPRSRGRGRPVPLHFEG